MEGGEQPGVGEAPAESGSCHARSDTEAAAYLGKRARGLEAHRRSWRTTSASSRSVRSPVKKKPPRSFIRCKELFCPRAPTWSFGVLPAYVARARKLALTSVLLEQVIELGDEREGGG